MARNCQEIRAQIQAALDGDLPPNQRKEFDGHLAVCPACRRSYEAAGRVISAFAAAPSLEPSANFIAAVLNRVREAKAAAARRRKATSWVITTATAAAAGVLVAAWLAVIQPLATSAAAWAAANGAKVFTGGWAVINAMAKPLGVFGKVAEALGYAGAALAEKGLAQAALPYAAAFGAVAAFYFLLRARRPAAAPFTSII